MSTNNESQLSARSRGILESIAAGRSYAQIVDANAELTYLDIFDAAAEAILLIDAAASPASTACSAAT